MDDNFVLLRLEEGTLGIEKNEMAVDPMRITGFRDRLRLFAFTDQGALGLQLFAVGRTGNQCVGDFSERSLNRLFIPGDGNIPVRLRQIKVGLQAPALEDREHHLGRKTPHTARAAQEQVGQTCAGESPGTGQTYAGEE